MNAGRFAALATLAALSVAAPSRATEPTAPAVTASGTGEVHIAPTRATFTVTVEAIASTSAAAAAENARVSKDVSGALLAAGLARNELTSSRLNVNAVWDTPKSGERRRRGYVATNTLQVDTRQLERLGAFIDAGLEAGAAAVSNPNFNADDRASARRQALALAVAAARDDAETIAKAAGGTLGELETLGTDGAVYASAAAPMALAQSRAGAVPTEIISSDITVYAHVSVRWAFVPVRR